MHHPAHVGHTAAGHCGLLLRHLRHDSLGGEDVLRDRRRVLQREARDLGRVDDPGLHEILVDTGLDVETVALCASVDRVDDDGAFETRVVRELPNRLLERTRDDAGTGPLVALIGVELDRRDGVHERDAAAGDDPLLECRSSGLERVLDAVLLLLHLRLGGSADLDDGDAAGQLREALLELLAVEVRVGVLDLGLQLLDPALDGVGLAGTVDDRGRILVDDDPAGAAQLRDLGVLELEAHLLGDDLAGGEDGDVLEHSLAAVTEAWRLDGDGLESAAQLVDDDGGERLALDVLGHDEQRPAGLDDLLQDGQEILDRADLLVGDEDERVLEHRLHPLGVGDHVRGQIALVELHALGELELEAECLALLDVYHTVLPDLLDRVGDDVADLALAR